MCSDTAISNEEWAQLDPRGRHPRERRRIDLVAVRFLRSGRPFTLERTRDVYVFAFPEHGDIRVVVSPEAVELRLSSTEWCGQHTPVGSSQLWRRLQHHEVADVDDALKRLHAAQRRRLRTCRHCQRRVDPAHMHSKDICCGCAERYLGVIY